MTGIRILINSIELNLNDVDGTEGASFVYRNKDDSGGAAFSFAPELTFTGAAFDLIYNLILSKPNPQLETVNVLVYDTCCKDENGNEILLFTGLINGSDVNWCTIPNCECSVTIVDNSQDAVALACLKNNFPWGRVDKFDGSGVTLGENTFRTAPLTDYCIDIRPGFLQELIFIYAFALKVGLFPGLFALSTVITAVNLIIAAINALGGNLNTIGSGNISFYDDIKEVIQTMGEIVSGCGFKHKTPFLHSQMVNLCEICGLTLKSSLFDVGGPYHNTMRLDAQYKPGARTLSKVFRNYNFNKPNINGVQFLDQLQEFNIRWEIVNGGLVIERKDYLSGGIWFDVSSLPEDDVISLCFENTDEKPFAFAEYEYTKDGVDNTGDETNQDWVDAVIDWNVPVNPAQSGLKSTNFTFSTAQFRQDSGRDDKSALDKTIYSIAFPILKEYQNVLLIERGICNFPKLLMWDGISSTDEARIKRYVNDPIEPVYDYNVDWWVKEKYVDGNGISRDTLYQRLFFIDDPRNSGVKNRGFNLKVVASCDLLRTMSANKTVLLPLFGVTVEGKIEEITLDKSTNTFEIVGKV